MIALPLQRIATLGSVFVMQLTGLWAIAEGNVITLRDHSYGLKTLEVAQACNGLSMLMTLAATVTATIMLIPLANWKRIVVLASAIPIALVSNIVRIVGTGWCYYFIDGERAKKLAHDWTGYLMMPLALILVGLELLVLSWLVDDSHPQTRALTDLFSLVFPRRPTTRSSPERQLMTSKAKNLTIEPVWVWGLPCAPMSLAKTVETVSALIDRGLPTFFITANTHYAMLTEEIPTFSR